MNDINRRLDSVKETINKFRDIAIETVQNKTQRKINTLNKMNKQGDLLRSLLASQIHNIKYRWSYSRRESLVLSYIWL